MRIRSAATGAVMGALFAFTLLSQEAPAAEQAEKTLGAADQNAVAHFMCTCR